MTISEPEATRRPNIGRLLTECALTLAEFPCPPQAGDTERILVVQEPYVDPKIRPDSEYLTFPCVSLLWFLHSKQGMPFEEAAVLGYSTYYTHQGATPVLADIAFDSNRGQYWVAILSGGERLSLSLHSITPRAVAALHRSSLVEATDGDWPLASKAVTFHSETSAADFVVGSNCRLVTSLAARVESDVAGSYLAIQAHSTGDWENKRAQVKLWTWRYAIDQGKLLSEEVADVPRPTQRPTEREQLKQKRREQWEAIIKVEADRRKAMFLRDAEHRPISQGGERTNDSGEGSSRK